MRKITVLFFIITVFLLGMMVVPVSSAAGGEDKKMHNQESQSLFKPTGEPRYQILNINNLWTWMRSDGYSNHSPTGDNGMYFPRGTAWVIYMDGIMWGGKCYTDEAMTQPAPYDQTIRVGGSNYMSGTKTGRVIGFGAGAVAADPDEYGSRIFKIRRDYYTMSEAELRQDVAEYFEIDWASVSQAEMDWVYTQYEKDWNEWPVDHGAPFIDRNGNGVYDPPPPFSDYFTEYSLIAGNYDEPGIGDSDWPADQVVWMVFNDLDEERTLALQGSYPMGLEVQVTIWGYKRWDALGNLFFRRVRLINKGGVDVDGTGTIGSLWIDSMYVGQWSDPDVGSLVDDLIGCDTLLNMAYAYNASASDSEFDRFGLKPPAVGYDILAGPIVPSPGDVAVFDMKYRNDYKNLGMTSFSWFGGGVPFSDPPRDYTRGTIHWYKMLRGYVPEDGPDRFYPFPPGVEPNPFSFSGDPVLGMGHLDGEGASWSFASGDRRMMCSTGPFTLAPGDTQEVVVAVVCGHGADRLSSISVMKFNDRFAQAAYDGQFQVPSPPSAPKVSVTELDGRVILEWGSDLAHVLDTERPVHEAGGYVFEGYNVYQFPSKTSSLSDAVRIAVYDLPDDPTVILDEQFDVDLGIVLEFPVQFGSNSGIKRYFEFDRDYVLDVDKITNGQEYYIAVTAYSRSTVEGYIPATLESIPQVIVVVPKVPFGTEYTYDFLDTLEYKHTAGSSDGDVYPIVINPSALTGDTYEVSFDDLGDDTTSWNLDNLTTGERLIEGETNQSGDHKYAITEGFQLKVVGAPKEVKSFQCVSNASGPIDPPVPAAAEWRGYPVPTDDATVNNQWLIATGDDAHGTRGPYSVFLSRVFRNGNEDMRYFIPWDWEIRFTERGSWTIRWFDDNAVFWAPFELWNIGIRTPDDPSDDYRCIPVIDGDDNLTFDLSYLDHSVSGGPNDPYTDWFYFYIPNDQSPGEAGYNTYLSQIDTVAGTGEGWEGGTEALARLVFVNHNGGEAPPYDDPLPETGSIFRILSTKTNTSDDVFQFVATAPEQSLALEKESAKSVGVFPNPYYGFDLALDDSYSGFVTFNNLPPKATIRIFNLAGQMVRKLEKDDPSQFHRWDLLNHNNFLVASGMYIAYIEMELPSGGKASKVLKLAIIQE